MREVYHFFFRSAYVLFQGRPGQNLDSLYFVPLSGINQTVVGLQQRSDRVVSITLLERPFSLSFRNSEVREAQKSTRFVETVPGIFKNIVAKSKRSEKATANEIFLS